VNRTQLDRIVTAVVGIVVLLGGVAVWQTSQSTGSHMGPGSGGMHTTQPLWVLIGTLLVAGVIVAIYLGVRSQVDTETKPLRQKRPRYRRRRTNRYHRQKASQR